MMTEIATVDTEVVMGLPKAEHVRRVVVARLGRFRKKYGFPFIRHHGNGGGSVVMHTSRGERYLMAREDL